MEVTGASMREAVSIAADVIRSYGLKRQKDKAPVWNVPVAFDTETTNYNDRGDPVGWLYIWMFRIGDPLSRRTEFFYGRDTLVLNDFLTGLSDALSLGKSLVYIYVHNLSFDLEFIRDRLNITAELHSAAHEPFFVRDRRGFEFRDSLKLSGGMRLQKIGEDLNNGLVKLCGDLDYDLIRTPRTPLDEKEMGYCQGDVDVLASYIAREIQRYNGLNHVPLTNTGRVRRHAADVIFGKAHKGAKARYRELMSECVLTYEEYLQCKRGFGGGFTHANIRYVQKLLRGVKSYDETSAYPTVMLSEKFPMGKPQHIDTCTYDELREMVNDPDCCILFDVQFSEIKLKDGVSDCYLSNDASKVMMESPISDNGRIRECGKYAATITDVDFKIIARSYDWDDIHISNVLKWRNDYLPSPIIDIVLDLYNAKTTLKDVEDRKDEYQIKKGMLNSMYGMCVTRILRDVTEVKSGEWITRELTEEEQRKNIEKNNNSMNRFLYYPWGVWITAYARFNLWTAILTLGDDYIYSDTDSIKVFSTSKKLEDYLKNYHEDLRKKFSWMLEKRKKFSFSDLNPKDVKGRSHPLGEWDYEGEYEMFKTLGSKRYLTYNAKKGIDPTVAGVSPKSLRKYLEKCCNTPKEMFDMFDDGLHVPDEYTGKLASIYYEDVDLTVTDYMGNEDHVRQRYGVHLAPVDFTLTMTGSFMDLVKMIQGVI